MSREAKVELNDSFTAEGVSDNPQKNPREGFSDKETPVCERPFIRGRIMHGIDII